MHLLFRRIFASKENSADGLLLAVLPVLCFLFLLPVRWRFGPADAAVSFMDEQVGRLLDRVDELGKTETIVRETIVVFHGDQCAFLRARHA